MVETPYAAGERAMLLAYLQRQRDLVVWKVTGLSDQAARQVASPSGLTIHGLLYHLRDVERSWLRRWFAGADGVPNPSGDPGRVVDPVPPETVTLAELGGDYVGEWSDSDAIVAAHGLDEREADGPRTLRWILHHLIEETSRHLGHLDLLSELVDGRTGEEPDAAGRP